MRKLREIPPSPDRKTLKTWVQKRMFYINAFGTPGWYPNCCVQTRINLDAAARLRKKLNQQDPDPAKRITFNTMINKAVANAMPNHILFNGFYSRRDTMMVPQPIATSFVVDRDGMASTLEIRDPDKKTLREIAEETNLIISARRAAPTQKGNKLSEFFLWLLPMVYRLRLELSHDSAMDFLGALEGTVVTTNPGTLGVQDCKAMLFFGYRLTCLRIFAMEQEAVIVDGEVRFRKVLPVGLDYDQRLCDSGPAARLLAEIRRNMEQPEEYLLGPAVIDPAAPFSWPKGNSE